MQHKSHKLLSKFIGAILFCVTIFAQAGSPVWTFIPLTPTSISVSVDRTASVQYQITNQSSKPHTLAMEAISGVTQITSGEGICGNPFILSGGASCTLSLQIDGSQVASGSLNGPIVCQQGSTLICYQPSPPDILTVTTTTSAYTVGGTVSGGLSSTVVLQNNGTDNLSMSSNGPFTFSTPIAEGSTYDVTILTQPEGQVCSVINGSGTMGGSNVVNVSIFCASTYTIGGTISGLSGTVVLQNNGANNLSINSNGSFTFTTKVANGNPYAVTVHTQPGGQVCSVTNAFGTVNAANITNVLVVCSANAFTIGGALSGLAASESIVLQNNGTNNLTINSNASFTFTTSIAEGSTYDVTILTQPLTQTCAVVQPSGTVGGSNVTNVAVACTTNTYTVGGAVSGLSGTVVLQNNGTNSTSITSNAAFTFSTSITGGDTYDVTVLTQPAGETCSVIHGSGVSNGANIYNVSVICSASTYTVGGSISGLSSGTVVLQNNGTNNLDLSSDGSFTFATALANDSPYNVTVLTQPSGQTCSVINGMGFINGANITSVSVTCSAQAYTVSGTVSGLSGTVFLNNNTTDGVSVTNNSSFTFTFPTALADGTAYDVTVGAQPTNQTCSVANGAGTISGANVTNVTVTCAAPVLSQWAYFTNSNTTTLSQCAINSTSGVLTCNHTGGGTGFNGPAGVVIDSTNNYAYATNTTPFPVLRCVFTPETGALSGCAITGSGFSTASDQDITVHGGYAYILNGVTNDNDTLIQCAINSSTGLLENCAPTAIGSGVNNPESGIAFYNNYAYMTSNIGTTQCAINASTGALYNCGLTGSNFIGPAGIAFSNGYAYVTNYDGGNLSATVTQCVVNPTTGSFSNCAVTAGGFGGPTGIGIRNGYAYVANTRHSNVSVCTIDALTGGLLNCAITGNGFNVPAGNVGFF